MGSPWRDAFTAVPGYLNTATVGLPPNSVADAVACAVEQWRDGALDTHDFDDYVTRARRSWAALVGVPAGQVAIGSAASPLVGLIAAALPDHAHVLVAEGDFTSVLFPLLAQCPRGVTVRAVPLDALVETVDERVDLVAVSVVQSANGRVTDVAVLTDVAAAHGAAVLLDATQACGAVPLDAAKADYLVCAAYKWLLCPRGTAFLSVRPDRLAGITPHAAGWYAGEDIWSSIYGTPLRLADDARRLDISPDWFAWAGAAPALEYVAAQDIDAIHGHDVALADGLLAELGRPEHGSAIVSLDVDGAEGRLAEAGIRAAVRDGRVRASFHLYNDENDVLAAARALRG